MNTSDPFSQQQSPQASRQFPRSVHSSAPTEDSQRGLPREIQRPQGSSPTEPASSRPSSQPNGSSQPPFSTTEHGHRAEADGRFPTSFSHGYPPNRFNYAPINAAERQASREHEVPVSRAPERGDRNVTGPPGDRAEYPTYQQQFPRHFRSIDRNHQVNGHWQGPIDRHEASGPTHHQRQYQPIDERTSRSEYTRSDRPSEPSYVEQSSKTLKAIIGPQGASPPSYGQGLTRENVTPQLSQHNQADPTLGGSAQGMPTMPDGDYARYTESPEQQRRQNSDESQQRQHTPKGLLNVSTEGNKRSGRISPLPQAVQGAQGQHSGPGSGPAIKSEFGRMFSGIGSGVGSVTPTTGPPVNGDVSQVQGWTVQQKEESNDLTVESNHTNGEEFKSVHGVPRGGRRWKPGRGEKIGSETGDGAASPAATGGRGAKRSRHPHPHHHHQPGHQADDDLGSPSPAPARSGQISSSDSLKRSSTPLQRQSPAASHPLHPRHHHHHHHTAPKPVPGATNAAPAQAHAPVPTLTVLSQGVIDSVSGLPSHHLGSMLYEPELTPSDAARLGFASTPNALPDFEGNENCTFTVRIPRRCLSARRREEIVERRYLWGTDIYTRDSDIVAAAIHTGWIRGEWAGDIDVSLLDLNPTRARNDTHKSHLTSPGSLSTSLADGSIVSAPPKSGPIVPPSTQDLHITVRILPTLIKYKGSVRRGIPSKSRASNPKTGTSFRIEKLRWVDEGPLGSQPRGYEARKRRLDGYNEARVSKDVGGVRFKSRKGENGKREFAWNLEAGPDAAP
ncbi:MAG: hypothetical protein M1833_006735 [Piccolia ochrophora]|nr:MAG: hypothetical protein M1833_006735 [Piccolia ochrophora]